jgi:hypothetical protein
MTCQRFNEEREELGFMGMKLSWHSYQLSMSHRIKCLWNYGMKLSIESGCFIRVSFHSIWHGSLGNNKIKLSTETGLIVMSLGVPWGYKLRTVQYLSSHVDTIHRYHILNKWFLKKNCPATYYLHIVHFSYLGSRVSMVSYLYFLISFFLN